MILDVILLYFQEICGEYLNFNYVPIKAHPFHVMVEVVLSLQQKKLPLTSETNCRERKVKRTPKKYVKYAGKERNALNMQEKRSGKSMKTKWKEMEDEWNAIYIH